MPKGLTRFFNTWLENRNENGHQLKLWYKKDEKSDSAGFCLLCQKTINCSNQGYDQLKQHAQTSKHMKLASAAFSAKQSQLITSSALTPRSSALWASSSETIGNSSIQKQVKGPTPVILAKAHLAEVIWPMKMAADDFSFSSWWYIVWNVPKPCVPWLQTGIFQGVLPHIIWHRTLLYTATSEGLEVFRKCVHFTLWWNNNFTN